MAEPTLPEGAEGKNSVLIDKEPPAWARYANVPLQLLGYGVLMGWHFLLIYFITAPDATYPDLEELFGRQMALNTSLAVGFLVVFLLGMKTAITARQMKTPALLLTGIVGMVSTGLAMYATLTGNFAVMTMLTAISGLSEAMLLLSWLHFYSESSSNYAVQYITLSLVIGALIAFLVRHLSLEVALPCFAILPAMSVVMLISSSYKTPARDTTRGERGVSDYRGAFKPLAACTAHLAIYSAVFGFLQGSIMPDGEFILAAFTPNTVIGAGLGGAIAMLVHHQVAGKRAPEMIRRISLFVFIVGILLMIFPTGITQELAGIAVMMGFILTDINCLIYVVRLTRTYDVDVTFSVGINRAAEYAAFALFIVLGNVFAHAVEKDFYSMYSVIVGGICITTLLGYTLASMGQGPLDWIDRLYPTLHSTRHPNNAIETAEQPKEETLSEKPEERAVPFVGRFKTACLTICDEAGLSPRESEVFMLMAKGRNAEYIQGALTISNYTAKTHIANIYRKVGVHSLQELIDRVEQTTQENAPKSTEMP